MSSRQRLTHACVSSNSDELSSFITFSQDDAIQTSSTPPKSKGDILRERVLSRTSQRSSSNWFLSPSMRTTSITESIEHEEDDDDDIADFSSQNTNIQDDSRHSDIQSFGDQSQDDEEEQQEDDVQKNADEFHETNTINNEKAQVSDNDDVKNRVDSISATITNVIDSCTDREAATLPYNPEESLENDLEVDTLPYDPQEGLSNDSDADTISYDPEGILPDDINSVYEADTAQYNPYDSLPPSPVYDDLPQPATTVSLQEPVLPSVPCKENGNNQSNADPVDFFEDSQFVVFSPTEEPQHQENRGNDDNISTTDELDEFDPDISDDELPGLPSFFKQQQESLQLFSIPAFDNPPKVPNATHLSSSNKSSSPPRTEQPRSLLSSRNSKQCSIYEEPDSFMDGMVSSLSTYKSPSPASQGQRQQQCSPPSQKQSSLLGYSRVVKSQSVLQLSQSSPDTKKSPSQHVISPVKKSETNNPQKTQRTRGLSQSSNSNISTHKYTLSSYYPIRKEETRVDSRSSYTPKKHNSSSQCTDPETSTSSPQQNSQSIDNNNTKNKSFQSSILHQITLPKSSSFSQSQSNHDDATLSSPRSSLRKPSIGLSRKHVISSPSKSSERGIKKHRPKLSDICKKTQPKRKKVYGLGRPSKSSI